MSSTRSYKILTSVQSRVRTPLKIYPVILSIPKNYVTSSKLSRSTFWLSMIPKPLRKHNNHPKSQESARAAKWNPSTFFIVFFLLIGSNAIQMISLKKDHSTFVRRLDTRIEILKEIIERIQNGEKVDVESLLGTGIKEREHEWEAILQEISREKWEHDAPYKSDLTNEKDVTGTNANERKPDAQSLVSPSNVTKTGAPPGFF